MRGVTTVCCAFLLVSSVAGVAGVHAQGDDAAGKASFFRADTLRKANKLDEAVAAYTRAADAGFQVGTAHYFAARIEAQRGNVGSAMKHLRTALDFGLGPADLDVPQLSSIKSDPGYPALLADAEKKRFPCRADHTFDFWAGEFESHPWGQPDSPSRGELHNTREYDGCVIVERWSSPGGSGMSMGFYDVNRHAWRMIWNDDSNSSNDFEGSFHDGAMRFEGWVLNPKGEKVLARNVLQPVGNDIRHQYSTSENGGKTWIMHSDGLFARKKTTTGGN